jgi:hypothetical protein
MLEAALPETQDAGGPLPTKQLLLRTAEWNPFLEFFLLKSNMKDTTQFMKRNLPSPLH